MIIFLKIAQRSKCPADPDQWRSWKRRSHAVNAGSSPA